MAAFNVLAVKGVQVGLGDFILALRAAPLALAPGMSALWILGALLIVLRTLLLFFIFFVLDGRAGIWIARTAARALSARNGAVTLRVRRFDDSPRLDLGCREVYISRQNRAKEQCAQ
jgi:hypothetical protein